MANSPGGQGCPSVRHVHSSEPADSAAAVSSGSYCNVAGKVSMKPEQKFYWANIEEQCGLKLNEKSCLFLFFILFCTAILSSWFQ